MQNRCMRPWQEECEYFGRHTQLVPAEFARGYQYRPYQPYADRNMVNRAIPVTGTVEPVSMFDRRALQTKVWFGEEKPTVLQRIARWLNK